MSVGVLGISERTAAAHGLSGLCRLKSIPGLPQLRTLPDRADPSGGLVCQVRDQVVGLNLRRFARQWTHLEALPAVSENLHDVTDEFLRKTHAPRALERGCGSIKDKRLGSIPPDKLGHA
jgi:hypothetical protein